MNQTTIPAPRCGLEDMSRYAAEFMGIAGWQGYHFEAFKDGTAIKGCVPDGQYTRGKSKGQPRYSHPVEGTERSMFIPTARLAEWARAQELENGQCFDCKGTKQVCVGWGQETGRHMASCKRCNGTGVAPVEAAA